jgi:hypothetical protein
MSTPRGDDRPTTVLPQAPAEQPSVVTAPATRRARVWQRKLPPRLGRARTSTVVIGCLFVLLFALNDTLPGGEGGTVPVTTSDGRTIQVPRSFVPNAPATAPTPATPATPATTEAPAPTTSAAPTSQAPRTTATDEDDDEPGTTAPTTTGEDGQRTTAPSTTTRAPATRTPATTTAAPESAEPAEPSDEPESSATPTG